MYSSRTITNIRVLLIVLFAMSGTPFCFSRTANDSIANAIEYVEVPDDTITGNMYLKFNLDVKRRNVFLQTIPHLYSIAEGKRFYVGESFGRYTLEREEGRYTYDEQLRIGTIRRQRMVFENVLNYLTPTIYNEEVFHGFILSPFNIHNKRFYRYDTKEIGDILFVRFRPRVRNSVLTTGTALINQLNGKVLDVSFNGEYDQIHYNLNVIMDSIENTPKKCYLHTGFKFVGNDIQTMLYASYDGAKSLPDTITESNNPELMAQIRPVALTPKEQETYSEYYDEPVQENDTIQQDTIGAKRSFRRKTLDFFDDASSFVYRYFIRSLRYEDDQTSIRFSPVFDPGALSYSGRKGLAYRIKVRGAMNLDENKRLSLNGRMGYNFKQKQFFFTAPLRYIFNEERKGYLEFLVGNGNRISNSIIFDKMKATAHRDTINFDEMDLEYYNKTELSLHCNIPIDRHFHVDFSTYYYRRSGVNKAKLEELGQKTVYHSFAPSLKVKYQPSRYVAYVFSYERSLPGVLGCDSKYEVMELDAQFSKRFNALSSLNVRVGGGLYTDMSSNYFVDYENFSENYLPEAWDEWRCNFFLLDSNLYNASRYYVRANVSYESPIMPLAYIPFLGYYVEKERIYVSSVQLHRTRPYFEVGYAFTTRYASVGIFASAFGSQFNEFGTKFTFELFKNY